MPGARDTWNCSCGFSVAASCNEEGRYVIDMILPKKEEEERVTAEELALVKWGCLGWALLLLLWTFVVRFMTDYLMEVGVL